MNRFWGLFKDLFWMVISVALVVGGVYGYRLLGDLRPEVVAQPVARPEILVDTLTAQPYTAPVPLRGEGFITPFRQVALAAETSGRIVKLHSAIESRGRFQAGDILVRLDDQTAQAALEQTQANIASTMARLDLNGTQLARAEELRTRGVIAQDQLDQLESQKSELEASLNALKAAERSARVARSRSQIRAPFDGAVLSKTAELGSVVSPGGSLATLYTIDQLEVSVPVGQSQAALIPGLFTGGRATARISASFAGQTYQWNGVVARVENALDARTRTLTVIVELTDRIGAATQGNTPASGAPPALINAFASVVIDGAAFGDLYAIPSTAYRDGNTVWLYSDGALTIVPANRIHVDGERSFVHLANLPAGSEIVTSSLETVFSGMPVRRVSTDSLSVSSSE